MKIVKMDKRGRIVVPADIREKFNSRVFFVEATDGEIRLVPIETIRLTELFDSIEVDVDDFTDTHKLKESLYKELALT
jgi:AbrB family looped-hinge helix DNA binding protein